MHDYSRRLPLNFNEHVPLKMRPVLLVPGNTGDDKIYSATIRRLLAAGYVDDEIYTVRQPQRSGGPFGQYMCEKRLTAVRYRIEEIKSSTGANEIDIIAASMGTLDAIAAMQGGEHEDKGRYNLGPPLDYIHTFLSIGGIYGGWKPSRAGWAAAISNLYLSHPFMCRKKGVSPGSDFLKRIHSRDIPAKRIAALYSRKDEIVGEDALSTGRIPGQRRDRIYDRYLHEELVTKTADEQLAILTEDW